MIRVLIVDDHEVVRRGLKEIFSDEFPAAQIGEADNSQTALEAILRQAWDLVLLDVDIPGRGGLEVLQELKRVRSRTPVLVLSVYPEGELAVRALQLGASGYLNKCRAAHELVAAVRKLLAGGKYITPPTAEKMAARLGMDPQGAPHESLSERELQILRRVAMGKTLKQIAAELKLSEKTVGTYRTRISQKTGLCGKGDLIRYAFEHRLAS